VTAKLGFNCSAPFRADDDDIILSYGQTPYSDADMVKKNALWRVELQVARQFDVDRVYSALEADLYLDDYMEWSLSQGRTLLLSVKSYTSVPTLIPFGDIAYKTTWDAEIDQLWDNIIAGLGNRPGRIWMCYNHEPGIDESYQTQANGNHLSGATTVNVDPPLPAAIANGHILQFANLVTANVNNPGGYSAGATSITCTPLSGTVPNNTVLYLQTPAEADADFAAAWRKFFERGAARPGYAAAQFVRVLILLHGGAAGDTWTPGGPADRKYPGSAYVDVVGFDGPYITATSWREFETAISIEAGGFLQNWLPGKAKPYMVPETSVKEDPGDPARAAAWITNMKDFLEEEGNCQALCYWSGGSEGFHLDTPPSGSALKLAAFADLAQSPFFNEVIPEPPPSPGVGIPGPVPAPLYRVILAALNGDARDEVPAKNLQFTYILNSPGSCSFFLPLQDMRTMRDTLDPGRTEIHIVRKDKGRVWGGYLYTALASLKGEVQFGGEGWFSELRRRLIDSTKTYVGVDQFDIAWDLIDFTQLKTDGGLGFTRGPEVDSAVLRTRTYNAYERKNLGEAIEELAAVEDGFDFEIDANKVFHMYYPRKGVATPVHHLSLGKNIRGLSWHLDATDTYNEVTALGSGEGASQLRSVAVDTALRASYKLKQKTVSFIDVSVQGTLDDHAAEELRLAKDVRDNPQLSAILTPDMPFGSIVVGDAVHVHCHLGFVEIHKDYRVVSITVAVSNEGEEAIGLFFDEVIA
jgi:hypothetical protein